MRPPPTAGLTSRSECSWWWCGVMCARQFWVGKEGQQDEHQPLWLSWVSRAQSLPPVPPSAGPPIASPTSLHNAYLHGAGGRRVLRPLVGREEGVGGGQREERRLDKVALQVWAVHV